MSSSRYNLTNLWLISSNLVTALVWCRVLVTIVSHAPHWYNDTDPSSSSSSSLVECIEILNPLTNIALWVSSIVEIFNCVMGFTRSPLPAVLLFSCTRMGVENLVAPLIPCTSWQHILTVLCWSMGDTIRFGTFAIHSIDPTTTVAKTIRFIIGPILFPIGALGEMMMVLLVANNTTTTQYHGHVHSMMIYVAAGLWPIFFYPMMKQLLKQRRKHFQQMKENKKQS